MLQDIEINIQKPLVFLSIISELSESEIKKVITFTIALKTTKSLGINLTKEVKDLYTDNYKTKHKTKKKKEKPVRY